ncbi:Hypothetical protein CINCED_3A025664 [Cinara cedri]|uniref:Uncharacterized protein n=1 Tax=Cinara cedri TaxID=506608 RepID=A0A5E4NK00_9HEMI|nr:Hypothetical protein CINCED_3A025664 [Cinara cedri]
MDYRNKRLDLQRKSETWAIHSSVEAENMKSPIKNEDLNEKIEKLDNQNKEIESNINTMLESIKLVTANVDQDSQELDAVNKSVLNAVIESDQHINAFKNFSKIHLDKITGDLKAIEELLIELQSKECEKSIVRKTVMDHLKTQLYSTNSNVEMCMKEMNSIKDQTDC